MGIDISVVVPTCNRPEKLKQCIRSILNQDYPKDKFEVIVVDDNSDERIFNLLEDLRKKYSNLRYFAQDCKGPATARNQGAKNSKGRIVGFVDDDCVLYSNWIRLMVEEHQHNPRIAAVGGEILTSTDKTPVLASQFLSTGSIETNVNGGKAVVFFPTCNVSVKRYIFDKYCFNEDFPLPGGEDLEFFWRLYKDGYRFIWDRNIKVIHYRDDTLSSFLRQAYYYGRGNFLVQYLHKDQPLLKEIKTGNVTFWFATLVNIVKIPRFCYLIGNRLIQANKIQSKYKKLSVYAYFLLHKVLYIAGNIIEFLRICNGFPEKSLGLIRIPQLLILDITHACNLNCKICDIWQTKTSEVDLDISYVKKMLSEAYSLGIKEIALSGGEPLVRNDIFEIFNYSRKLGIKNLGVLTNGCLVDDNLEKLKTYLLDNTISLVISFDSLKPELHNQIRNSSFAWQKTKNALDALSLLKKQFPQVNFNVITIILDQNLEELLKLTSFIKTLGVNSLQFQALLPNNLRMAERKTSPFWIKEGRLNILDSVIDELVRLKEGDPRFISNSKSNFSFIKKYYRGTLVLGEVMCLSTEKTILVANQGDCVTCFSSFGDIKSQGFQEILRGTEIIKARKQVKQCSWPCLLPCFTDN